MFHKQVNKYFGNKQVASARQVSTSRSHNKRDADGNDMHSRSMRRHHHYPRKSTRITHAISGPGRSPSVYPIQRQRRRLKENILQGELKKKNPTTFNGEHRKGEEAEA
jgi:hypothetical protein